MVESMTILMLFGVYAITYVGVSCLTSVKCRTTMQFVTTALGGVVSYAVVGFFNEQRAAWKSSGIGPMPDHLMNRDDIRLYIAFGVCIIVSLGWVHLLDVSERDRTHEWTSTIYIVGAIAMAAVLVVFPTAKRETSKETNNVRQHASANIVQETVQFETVVYDGQSNTDVLYLSRNDEKTWVSVSEPTTIPDVEWSKQWRVRQDDAIVPINHTPTLSASPKLRIDMGEIDSEMFTSWLATMNKQIRITRVIKQHITDSSSTLPRDVIIVYYEPVDKQLYQQFKDAQALDAKVNPEKHTK